MSEIDCYPSAYGTCQEILSHLHSMKRKCIKEGNYRYLLSIPVADLGTRTLFILSNPSTADENEDDPTTRNLQKWAREQGISDVVIANLYAYCSSRPGALKNIPDTEASGSKNDLMIEKAAREVDQVIVAWGNPSSGREREEFDIRARTLLSMLLSTHPIVYCVGHLTKDGYPRHPRHWYIAKEQEKRVYKWNL